VRKFLLSSGNMMFVMFIKINEYFMNRPRVSVRVREREDEENRFKYENDNLHVL
jgi:hypothetical protein